MKRFLVIMLASAANISSFAQTDVDMGEEFSLRGRSIMFFKTEKADKNVKPSSKIWHLEGNVVNGSKKVLFWLSDPNTEENTDSAEWDGNAQVVMRLKESGAKAYIVQDDDSTYLSIINIQDDVYGVQMYTSARKGAIVTKAGWEITKMEADELKGNEAYKAYKYNLPGEGSFIFWGFDEFQYRICSSNGIFNYEFISGPYSGSYTGEIVNIGLYDASDKLIEKFEMWLDKESGKDGSYLKTRNAGGMNNPMGQKGKVKKIFKHLQGDKGYVRIVATRYNRPDFDIKIPPLDIKE
jgi:hypothetical protein